MDQKKAMHMNTRVKLKEERLQRGWSQQHVADQLGTAVVTVNRWERGSQQPSAYFRLKLCALFGKSAEELGLVPEPPAVPTETETSRSVEPLPHLGDVPAAQLSPEPELQHQVIFKILSRYARRRSVSLFVLVTVLIMIVISVGEYTFLSVNTSSLQMKATATAQTSRTATSVMLTRTASSSETQMQPTTSYLPSLEQAHRGCTTSLTSNPLSQRDLLGTPTIISVYVNCMQSSYTVAMDWRDGTASSVWCPSGSCNEVTFTHTYSSPFSSKLTKAFIWNVAAVYQYVTVY